jgi:hypothetical protein
MDEAVEWRALPESHCRARRARGVRPCYSWRICGNIVPKAELSAKPAHAQAGWRDDRRRSRKEQPGARQALVLASSPQAQARPREGEVSTEPSGGSMSARMADNIGIGRPPRGSIATPEMDELPLRNPLTGPRC